MNFAKNAFSKIAPIVGSASTLALGVNTVGFTVLSGKQRYDDLTKHGFATTYGIRDDKLYKVRDTRLSTRFFDGVENTTHRYVRLPLDVTYNAIKDGVLTSAFVASVMFGAFPMDMLAEFSPSAGVAMSEIAKIVAVELKRYDSDVPLYEEPPLPVSPDEINDDKEGEIASEVKEESDHFPK